MQFLNLGEQYTEDVLGKRKQKHPRSSAEIKNLICPVSSNFPQLMYVYISTVIIVNISQKGVFYL